jgi:polar amino acid transport system substrate-binding protein
MLNAFEIESVDATAANISIMHAREQKMDFHSRFCFRPRSNDAKLSRPFCGFCHHAQRATIMAAKCCWCFSYCRWIDRILRTKNPHILNLQHNAKFGEGLWWAVYVVTNASFTIFTPVIRSGRLVGYGLIIIGLFAVSAFVAQITSALTVGKLCGQIDGVIDHYGKQSVQHYHNS